MSKKVTKVLVVLLVGMIFVLSSCGGPQACKKRCLKKSCCPKKACSLKKSCDLKKACGSKKACCPKKACDLKKACGSKKACCPKKACSLKKSCDLKKACGSKKACCPKKACSLKKSCGSKKSCCPKKACDLKKKCGRKVKLTGSDLSSWKQVGGKWNKELGDWIIAGDAFLRPENEKLLATKPGVGVMINGDKGKCKHLLSKAEFGDIKAHVEYMVARKSNSGVYFMGRYEIQILNSYGKDKVGVHDNGAIYQRWDEKRTPKGYQGKAPRVNASLPPGQWQKLDVIFRAPRFDADGKKIANAKFEKVVLNGIVIHENEEVTGPTRAAWYPRPQEALTGPIFLQGEHGPVAYRNICIVPLED